MAEKNKKKKIDKCWWVWTLDGESGIYTVAAKTLCFQQIPNNKSQKAITFISLTLIITSFSPLPSQTKTTSFSVSPPSLPLFFFLYLCCYSRSLLVCVLWMVRLCDLFELVIPLHKTLIRACLFSHQLHVSDDFCTKQYLQLFLVSLRNLGVVRYSKKWKKKSLFFL